MTTTTELPHPTPIAPDLVERLQRLAQSQSISLDDALAQAVSLAEIVQQTLHDPHAEILLVRDGTHYRIDLS